MTVCSCRVTYAFQSESTLYSLAKWLSVHLRTKWFWSSLTFEQGVPRYSRNYRLWIYSETCTWHDKYSQMHRTDKYSEHSSINHLASLAKWLSDRLRTKWFWVQVQLQSLKLQILRLHWARSSLTFRQL